MRSLLHSLLLLSVLLISCTSTFAADVNSTLASTSFCANVLSYKFVALSDGIPCQEAVEKSNFGIFPQLMSILPAQCQRDLSVYMCSYVYSPYPRLPTCSSLCTATVASCGPYLNLMSSLAVPFNCSAPSLVNGTGTTDTTNTCNAPPANAPTPTWPSVPQCANYITSGGSVCAGVIDYPVYIDSGSSFAAIESQASLVVGPTGFAFNYIPVNDTCRRTTLRQVCTLLFPRCDNTVLPNIISALSPALASIATVPFPSLPCNADCVDYSNTCSSYFTGKGFSPVVAGLLTPNCSSVGLIYVKPTTVCGAVVAAGQPDFPVSSTLLGSFPTPLGPAPLITQCNAYNTTKTSKIVNPSGQSQPMRRPSFCATVLNYTNVYVADSIPCQDVFENTLSLLPQVLSIVPQGCREALSLYTCSNTYTPYPPLPVCRSVCQNMTAQCAPFIPILSQLFPVDCTLPAFFDGVPGKTCNGPIPSVTPPPRPISPPQCVDYAASGGSFCKNVIDYPVYINSNSTLAAQEATVQRIKFTLNLIPKNDLFCQRLTMRQLCTVLFPRCNDNVVPPLFGVKLSIPFPSVPCNSECQEFMQCARYFNSSSLAVVAPILVPNCTGVGNLFISPSTTCGVVTGPGQPDFPVTSQTLGVLPIGPGIPLASTCNSYSTAKTSNISYSISCPSPLVVPDDPEDALVGGSCAVPCPLFIFTTEEYDVTNDMVYVLSIISFICTLFLLVTWLAFIEKRKQVYQLSFTFCICGVALNILAGVGAKGYGPRLGCKNNAHPSIQSPASDFCPWNGAIMHLLPLCAGVWWCVISVDLALKVYQVKFTAAQKRWKEIIYKIFGWGIPSLFTVIAAGLKGYGGSTGLSWCFFNNDSPEYVANVLFWGPIIFLFILGSSCMFFTLYTLFLSSKRTGTRKKPGWWKQYVRPILYIMEFVVVFGAVCAYKFYQVDYNTKWSESSVEFVSCLLGPGGGEELCGKHPAERPNVGFWRFVHFCIVGQGIIAFIVFGTQSSNYTLWYNLCFVEGMGWSQKSKNNGSTTDTDSSQSGPQSRSAARSVTRQDTATGASSKKSTAQSQLAAAAERAKTENANKDKEVQLAVVGTGKGGLDRARSLRSDSTAASPKPGVVRRISGSNDAPANSPASPSAQHNALSPASPSNNPHPSAVNEEDDIAMLAGARPVSSSSALPSLDRRTSTDRESDRGVATTDVNVSVDGAATGENNKVWPPAPPAAAE